MISPPAKLPVLHRIRKDDGLERMLNEFQNDNAMTQEPQDDFDKMLAGAPMRLLEKFRNSPVTTGSSGGSSAASAKEKEKEDREVATPEAPLKSIRKSLMFGGSAEKVTPGRRRSASKEITPVAAAAPVKTTPAARQRRKTTLFTPRVTSVEEEVESPAVVEVVQKSTRTRRKTLAVSMDENSPVKRQDTIRSPKAMELSKQNSGQQENVPPAAVRNSIYSPSKMEQSSDKTDKVVRIEMGSSPRRTLGLKTSENVIKKVITPELDAKDLEAFRTNRRRTLYTPGVYDESDKVTAVKETPVLSRRSTFFNPPANSTATVGLILCSIVSSAVAVTTRGLISLLHHCR